MAHALVRVEPAAAPAVDRLAEPPAPAAPVRGGRGDEAQPPTPGPEAGEPAGQKPRKGH